MIERDSTNQGEKLYCNGININLGYINSSDYDTDIYKKNTTDEGYTLKCESADYTIWFRSTNVYPFTLGGFQVVDKNGNIDYNLSGIGQSAINSYANDRIKGVLCAIYSIFDNVALSNNITIDIPTSYKNCSSDIPPYRYDPTVELAISPSSITEDNGVSSVTATLSEASDTDVKIFLSFKNTAQIDIDYIVDKFIIIPAGQIETAIQLTAIRDATNEKNEFIEIDIQKIEGHAIDGAKGPQIITIQESPHATLAELSNVHTYIKTDGTIRIMWSSTGTVNEVKWRKNSSTTETSLTTTCVNGNCFAVISGIQKTDLANYKISTSNLGDPGSDKISGVTNAFQGENCIECLCDGEVYTIGNKTFDPATYTIEWRNSSGAAVPEFNGKTTVSTFDFKLNGINTYVIKRTNSINVYDEAEVLIKPVLNCTWFLQARDLTLPSGSGPRVAKNGQTLQLIETQRNSTGIDGIVEMVEGSTKNTYIKGEPSWEKDAILISNQTSAKNKDNIIHNQFNAGNESINPQSSFMPDNNSYNVNALNKMESVEIEYFYENQLPVSDPLSIPELALYHDISSICIEVGKAKANIDAKLNKYINNPINTNAVDPMNNLIVDANSAIVIANTALPANTQIPLIPLIPHANFAFPIGCNILNDIKDINAEKQSSPIVVRDTYGKYNINLTGSGTIPIGIGDLTVTTNPLFLSYDKNLRKTPDIPPSLTLVSNDQTLTFSRAFPDGSLVQLLVNVNIIAEIHSPCTKNPAPCLIEMVVTGTLQITPISNSPFILDDLLPVIPPTPPIDLGSYVLVKK